MSGAGGRRGADGVNTQLLGELAPQGGLDWEGRAGMSSTVTPGTPGR